MLRPKVYDVSGKRIWVAGHRGMVGSAVVRRLASAGCEILTATREEVDLTRQADVERWLDAQKPDAVILSAARVGGILANSTFPADFLSINLMIGTNIITAAHRAGVKRLINLGSACMYPVGARQPIAEASFMTGRPEPTNHAYAVAKIAIASLAAAYRQQFGADYITVVPTNLFGPGDNLDPAASHVIPALMGRMMDARNSSQPEVTIWGSGEPRREFMFVDDAADAIAFALEHYSSNEILNIGTGRDISIRELSETVASVVSYRGTLTFDRSKPDGAPRRMLDSSRLAAMGWRARTALAPGLEEMYRWYASHRTARVA